MTDNEYVLQILSNRLNFLVQLTPDGWVTKSDMVFTLNRERHVVPSGTFIKDFEPKTARMSVAVEYLKEHKGIDLTQRRAQTTPKPKKRKPFWRFW